MADIVQDLPKDRAESGIENLTQTSGLSNLSLSDMQNLTNADRQVSPETMAQFPDAESMLSEMTDLNENTEPEGSSTDSSPESSATSNKTLTGRNTTQSD